MSEYAITKDKLMAMLPTSLAKMAGSQMLQRQDRNMQAVPQTQMQQFTQPQPAPMVYEDPIAAKLQLSPEESAQSLAAMRAQQQRRMQQIMEARQRAMSQNLLR